MTAPQRTATKPKIGSAFADAFNEGWVTREQLWITSKLWNNRHAPEDVLPALQQTLTDLQLDYLDLYLMHWPMAFRRDVGYPESAAETIPLSELPIANTWSAMEPLVDDGQCRHLGVANFSTTKLAALLEVAQRKPEVNQVELHPFLQQPEMLDFCRNHSIGLTAYAPLGSGGRPERLKSDDEPVLLTEPMIVAIANSHSITPAQVLIAWALHRGTAAIPKSVNADRLAENLAAAEVELTAADLQSISELDRGRRYFNAAPWDFPGGSYSPAQMWDT